MTLIMNVSLVMMVFSFCLPFGGVSRKAAPGTGMWLHMVVTAESLHGSNLPLIRPDDLMVYEGHNRDQVTGLTPLEGEHAGLDLFILLDDAASDSLGSQLSDIQRFIDAEPATTRIGVAYMQNGAAQIVQTLTTDHAQASKSLRPPLGIAGVNASPYFSLDDLIKRWPETGDRREVLAVTDGIDRFWGSGPGDPYVESVIEDAQRAGVIVFGIYTPGAGHEGHSLWRTYWGQIYLSRVGDETGGESYSIGFNGPPVSFAPYLDDVAHRVTRQYLLSFLAQPEQRSGMQRVKIMTEVPNVELVGADSVYVPTRQQ